MPKKAHPSPDGIRTAYSSILSELQGYLGVRQFYTADPYGAVPRLSAEGAQQVVDGANRFAELAADSPAVSDYERLCLVGHAAVLAELYRLPEAEAAAS